MTSRIRTPRLKMTDDHRNKIASSNILSRLLGHVEGTVELSPTQVTAGIALLRKVMPDLTQVDAKVETTHYVLRAPEPAKTIDGWLEDNRPKQIGKDVQ